MAKAKNPKYTTPLGVAVYPSLNRPDEYNGKITGYKVDLKMSREDAQPLIDDIEKQMKVVHKQLQEETGKKINIAKLNRPYFEDEEDEDMIVIRCKQNHVIKDDGVKIMFFDAKGKPIGYVQFDPETDETHFFSKDGKKLNKKEMPFIRGGSQLKIAGTLYGYGGAQKGLKLTISAVQIIDLAQGGGASADNFGFGEEEGFSADEYEDDEAPFDTDVEEEGFEDDSDADFDEDEDDEDF